MNAFYLQNDPDSPACKQDTYMPVQTAAEYSGYSAQYLRRLLNNGTLKGLQIGQVWLVRVTSLDTYIRSVRNLSDRRFGPRVFHEYMEEKEDDQADP